MYFEFALRRFDLPEDVPGALYASPMPGMLGDFEQDIASIRQAGIDRVVCLAGPEEVRVKAPFYAAVLRKGSLGWPTTQFGIPDGDAPADREAFLALAREVAADLRAGQRVLIHCAAGIGRTGMLAVLVLMALGQGLEAARRAVRRAGSGAEGGTQWALEEWAARQLGADHP